MAEKLWEERKYDASIREFKKIVSDNPNSLLGEQALYRIGVTQYLYTNEFIPAINSFRSFIQITKDEDLKYQAQKNIADIYFTKLEVYQKAIEEYSDIIKRYPTKTEKDIFQFKIAKSYFYRLDYKKSLEHYNKLIETYPASSLVSESEYQIASIYFTLGQYEDAIENYLKVINKYPNSMQEVLSKFGLANSLAEMNDLDGALKVYKEIINRYPSKNVILMKIKKLRARRTLKGM